MSEDLSLTGGADDAGTSNVDPGATAQSGDAGSGNEGSVDLTGDSGDNGFSFPDGLEDDVKNDPSLKVFLKDGEFNYGNLMKSYVHAQKKMGEKGVHLPTDKSSAEEWEAFHNMLRPSELDKYELKNEVAEGQTVDEELFAGFKEIAHKSGMTTKQAQNLLNWYNESQATATNTLKEQEDASYAKEVEALKADWGENFDGQLSLARRALKEFADEDTLQYLQDTKLDGNVQLIRLFNKIGKGLMEDTFDGQSHGHFGKSKEDALAELNRIIADPAHPVHHRDHASHRDALNQYEKLGQIAYS